MADDLSPVITIGSAFTPQGTKEAAEAMNALSARVNALEKSLNDAGGASDKFTGKQEVSKREIKILTAELLRSIGATQGAGAAGRVAAEGFVAMGDAANFANLALAASGLAVVTLLPKLIEWISHSKDATQEQKDLEAALKQEVTRLDDYLTKLKQINPELAAIAQHFQNEQFKKESEDLKRYSAEVDKLNAEIGLLNKNKELQEHAANRAAQLNAQDERQQKEIADALEKKRKQLGDVMIQEQLLTDAQARGLTVDQFEEQQYEKDTETLHKKAEAEKQLAEEQRKRFDQEAAYDKAAAEQDMKDKNFAADFIEMKDAMTAKDRAFTDKNVDDVNKRIVAEGKEILKEAQHAKQEAKLYQERTNAVRQFHEESVASGLKATAAFMGLFSKNKAINIAAALADTYAAADKSLNNPPGPPWTIPFAALAVAEGLANVKQIEHAGSGFDDPRNDLMAEQRGAKWAADLLFRLDKGFNQALDGRSFAGGGSSVTNNYPTTHTVVDNSSYHSHAIVGAAATRELLQLKRKLVITDRLYNRGKIGGNS